MIVNNLEQVVPTFNQLAFVSVLDQFNFLLLPNLFNIVKEILKNRLTTSLRYNIFN